MWHLKVPKIIHFYWGGQKLAYLRLLTIKSFMKHNPEWGVYLWTPKKASNVVTWAERGALDYEHGFDDFTNEMMTLPINKGVFNPSDYGLNNEMSEVHKSDILRLILLATYGGVWSDLDILYFKSIDNLKVNNQNNKNRDTFFCISHYGHSIGFLMSCENNKHFNALVTLAKQNYINESHQCMGADIYNKSYPVIPDVNIDMEAVYAYNVYETDLLYNKNILKFTPYSIGCHWYAGHHTAGKFLRDTNGGQINLPDTVIGNLIKNEKI